MRDIYVIDFETYYDKEYTLSKLPMYRYVMDDRFEAIMLGWKNLKTGETGIIRHKDLSPKATRMFDGNIVVAHNAMFDAAILRWVYGASPEYIYDTLSMARAWLGPRAGTASLRKVASTLGLPEKMHVVEDMKGVHADQLSDEDWRRYEEYCLRDVELCGEIFTRFIKEGFPHSELALISLVTKMYTEPVIEVDTDLLRESIEKAQTEKFTLIAASGVSEPVLSSNIKFAKLFLEVTGVWPGNCSKNAPELRAALAGRYGEKAKTITMARIAVKSNIKETRAQRVLDAAEAHGGLLPVPLRYYGAHTGRFSGLDRLNLQNLPRGSDLRKAMMAPEGYVFVVGDSSNIEARMLAYEAQCNTLLDAFRKGEKIYEQFAARAFGKPVDEIRNPSPERFVGKTCILGLGYGVGPAKLEDTLLQGGVSEAIANKAATFVSLYRATYREIPALWEAIRRVLSVFKQMVTTRGAPIYLPVSTTTRAKIYHDADGQVMMTIGLPNGLKLQYMLDPQYSTAAELYARVLPSVNVPQSSGSRAIKLWQGLVCENIIQALSRIVMTEQMLKISGRYDVCLTVHDEIVAIAPEDEAEEARRFVKKVMDTPPKWAPDFPVSSEVGVGKRYGDAK